MKSLDTATPDVLIAGAGPTGMLLGCALVHQGLGVRIVDAGKGPTLDSKAQVIHARTLEILEQLGIADRFVERGPEIFDSFKGRKSERLSGSAVTA